ncbi:MAG TPA: MarR family transcriptional regulator [Geopsychrobacteraceae bacterium]|nr:MarR family transcriptional regulator [Geopsychrobacteraceae bacterium]
MDITEKILEVMRAEGQPLNAGKIAELGGLERKAVDKAMAQMKKDEKIVSPKRCYWTPA